MYNFTNRVVIITGAMGELGMAVTLGFHKAGAQITCVDQARDRLSQVFAEHLGSSDHFFADCIDSNDPISMQGMVAETIHRFGRLDVLVNTVGGFRSGTPVHETPLETWDLMMNLNARSAFISSQAVLPQMLKQGSGAILHIAARPGLAGKANMAAYSASKSAVIRLTESMAAEYREAGIRVNCIIPGTIDTPRNRRDTPNADPRRWVKPASLAEVILFLASDSARDISGVALPVYGRS